MDPFMLASFGLNLLGGLSASSAKKAQRSAASAQMKVQKVLDSANAYAAGLHKETSNQMQAAQVALVNSTSSINAQRKVTAGGAAIDSLRVNTMRTMDTLTKGGLAESVRAAEELGAFGALAAAQGTGGSTVDMVQGTRRLRLAMEKEQRGRQKEQITYDFQTKQNALIGAMVGDTNMPVALASLDYGLSSAPARIDQSSGGGFDFLGMLANADWKLLRDGLYEQPTTTTQSATELAHAATLKGTEFI